MSAFLKVDLVQKLLIANASVSVFYEDRMKKDYLWQRSKLVKTMSDMKISDWPINSSSICFDGGKVAFFMHWQLHAYVITSVAAQQLCSIYGTFEWPE